jgi:hypothetical protein
MEKWIVNFPILAASVALSFDVGYFFGVDISFYTLFTLWEHILFAIQVLPFVLLLMGMAVVVGGMVIAPWSWGGLKEINSSIFIRHVTRRRPPRKLDGATIILVGLFLVVCVLLSIYGLFIGIDWLLEEIGVGLTLFLFFIVAAVLLTLAAGGDWKLYIVVLTFLIFCNGASFVSGHALARKHVESPADGHILLQGDAAIRGRLIRAGERGVLYVSSDNNRIIFQAWSKFDQIETGTDRGLKTLFDPSARRQ